MGTDELVRAVSHDGGLAIRSVVATEAVSEAARRHQTAPTASAALGRALMASALLAAGGKDGETVQIQVRGDGPLGSLTAIADDRGGMRGYVTRPQAHPPIRSDGKLDVGGAVGRGLLSVVRNRPGWRKPYRSVVQLVSGEIAEDVAHYLLESEQVPSAMALGVFVSADGGVTAAGGFLVQALPGASEDLLARLEGELRELPAPTQMIREGLGAGEIIERMSTGIGTRSLSRGTCRFACPCDSDRVLRALTLLGRAETRELAREGEPIEVRCEFCGSSYVLAADEVARLHADA